MTTHNQNDSTQCKGTKESAIERDVTINKETI